MTTQIVQHGPAPAIEFLTGSPLGWATAVSLLLVPMRLAPLVLDPRILDGEALWPKPLKFQISMAVLCGTLALAVAAALSSLPIVGCSWFRVEFVDGPIVHGASPIASVAQNRDFEWPDGDRRSTMVE